MKRKISYAPNLWWIGLLSLVLIQIDFAIHSAYAQSISPESFWIKAIGGANPERSNYAPSIIVTDDGYVIVGYSNAFDSAGNLLLDFLEVKLDKDGNPVWSKVIGGTWNDKAYVIRQTADGGYFIAGLTELSHNQPETSNILIVKLAADGTLEWSKTIDSGTSDVCFSARTCQDGGFIIAGGTNVNETTSGTDVLLVKLDATGALMWAKTYGGTGNEHAAGVEITSDGGFIVSGITSLHGQDALVLKLTQDGTLQWAKSIGGNGLESNNWDGVRQAEDGSYLLGGATKSYGAGGEDFFLVKLKPNGSLDWSRAVGTIGEDACWTFTPTSDGGAIAGGRLQDEAHLADPGFTDVPLVKFDKNGNMTWATKLSYSPFEEIEEIKEIDKGYVIAGIINSSKLLQGDYLVAKVDSGGKVPGCGCITPITPNVAPITPTVINFPLASTDVTGKLQVKDANVSCSTPLQLRVQTVCFGTTPVRDKNGAEPEHFYLQQNYPNPFNPSTTIRFSLPQRSHVMLKVFDVLGREVATLVDGEFIAGDHSVVFDAKGLPSGVYFYRLTTPTFSQTKPMEVIK